LEQWKVTVVQAKSSRQFPHPLDRIQLGAVRRQVVQHKLSGAFFPPLPKQSGVVVLGMVRKALS
jgi:hypothetical protein